ncbi:MerR family transcriptional regulator [Paenibacillus sp. LPE1-1-1.1]
MTIAEVSKKINLSADTLRYYERIGLIPRVNRTKGGIRNYTEEDCRWVEHVKCMRGIGFSVELLMEYARLYVQGEETIEARKELLIEQRKNLMTKMEEMTKVLGRMDDKIAGYEQANSEISPKLLS